MSVVYETGFNLALKTETLLAMKANINRMENTSATSKTSHLKNEGTCAGGMEQTSNI